jgi:hypothetical protein
MVCALLARADLRGQSSGSIDARETGAQQDARMGRHVLHTRAGVSLQGEMDDQAAGDQVEQPRPA